MDFALLTAALWSASSIASARTAKMLGGVRANCARLLLAVFLLGLGIWCWHGFSFPVQGWWFVLSGAIGLGLGDIALFSAYARLGARLPALFTHCLGAPLGAALEWLWLGTPCTWPKPYASPRSCSASRWPSLLIDMPCATTAVS